MVKKNKRDEVVFLEDMLYSIEKTEEYLENLTEIDFKKIQKNRML